MDVEIRDDELLSPRSALGPYRASDYWKLPDDPRCELIYGRLYVSPSPSPLHQFVAYLLWDSLRRMVRPSRGLVLGAPCDTVFAEHSVVQPDVLYVAAERRSIVEGRIEGVPDLAIEVLSGYSRRRDRLEKLRLYAEFGVREYWIVDPESREIEFLINRDGVFNVAVPIDDTYRSEVFPEIRLDIAAFWKEVEENLP